MSAVLPIKHAIEQWNFFMEKPTQCMDKKLLIEGSEQNLKISVRNIDGKIYPVEKHMIEGLPKMPRVSEEFFNLCYAKLATVRSDVRSKYKIYFNLGLKGGGVSTSSLNGLSGLNGHNDLHEYTNISSSLESIRSNLKNIITKIKEDSLYIIEIYDSLPKINESQWSDLWEILNKELKEYLENPNLEVRKHDVIKNIEKRIEFSRNKRKRLTEFKIDYTRIIIHVNQEINLLENKIEYGLKLELDTERISERRSQLLRNLGIIGLASMLIENNRSGRSFWDVPTNIFESLLWFKNAKLLIEEAKKIEPKINEKIIELDNETIYLEQLFNKMKLNKSDLLLQNIKKINMVELQKILETGEKLVRPQKVLAN